MALVQTLTDRDQDHFGPPLPPGLRELYDGDLRFRESPANRPFVIANFVSTLDGVASYEIKGQAGGSAVSGSDTADGFIMGLLRASADAIIVGARTVHDASPEGLWIPEYTYPDAKLLFREYRVNVLHKPEHPCFSSLAAVADWSWREQLSERPECAQQSSQPPPGAMYSRPQAQRNCPLFRSALWMRKEAPWLRWRCCDCSMRSLGYAGSFMKAGLHSSDNF